jgi:hypothetical protein
VLDTSLPQDLHVIIFDMKVSSRCRSYLFSQYLLYY